jgi:hypothetical protein
MSKGKLLLTERWKGWRISYYDGPRVEGIVWEAKKNGLIDGCEADWITLKAAQQHAREWLKRSSTTID